jgi:hypothetical protein
MIRLSTAALLVAATLAPSQARAEPDGGTTDAPVEDPPAPDPMPELPPEPEVVVTTPPPAPAKPPLRFPQHFLFGNGLSLVLTRLSVGWEFLPVAHHSLGVNIHGQYGGGIVSELAGVKGAFVGVGGEIGYRFYAWREGPFGPFFGMCLLGGVYHTQASIFRIDPDAFNYVQYGPAVDFGWAVHLDRTTVLALSVGAQYTIVSVNPRRLPELTRLLVGDGPRPRGNIQVGKVF